MFYFDQEDFDSVISVMRNKKLFRYQGPGVETECLKFEKELAEYLGGGYSVALSSGTNALITALKIFGINEGDDVIVPSYTFFATVSAVLSIGANPIVININEDLNYDLEELASKISSKTKAIIVVHMDGVTAQIEDLVKIAKDNSIYLIEDVAQAIGGDYKGKKLGSFGDAGCFSFNVDKNITCGEGGAIFVKEEILYQKALLFHDGCNQFGPTLKNFYTIEKFLGSSMRISEIQGALLRSQLKKLPLFLNLAKERYEILNLKLKESSWEIVDDKQAVVGNIIRIRVGKIKDIKELILSLNKLEIKALTASMKPAHNPWQWCHYLKDDIYKSKITYLKTIDVLSSALIIYIDPNLDLNDWKKKCDEMITILNTNRI